MTQGHIRISRAILDWRWIDEPVMVYFWLHILLMANWCDKEWHETIIKRGSFITTISNLSGKLNLSVQQVRTCINRLRDGGEINTRTSNSHTLITICKYDDYQSPVTNEQQTNNKPTTNEEQTNNKRITTTKEYKEEYNTSDTNVSSYSIPKERREEKKKEKEEDTSVSSKKERTGIDFDFIIELWNANAKRSIPKVRALSQERKEKIKLRIAEMGGWEKAKETMAICFQKIGDSDFCNGANGKWAANIDWFFKNAQNWLKVLEGNYDNRKPQSRIQQYADTANRFNALMDELYGPDDNGTANSAGYTPDEQ